MKARHNPPSYQYLPTLQQPTKQREDRDVYGFTALRLYGFTALRLYGFTALRLYGFTALRLYGFTALRLYGFTWQPQGYATLLATVRIRYYMATTKPAYDLQGKGITVGCQLWAADCKIIHWLLRQRYRRGCR
jgi:hypothetical protein